MDLAELATSTLYDVSRGRLRAAHLSPAAIAAAQAAGLVRVRKDGRAVLTTAGRIRAKQLTRSTR